MPRGFWRKKFLSFQNNRLVMISSKTYDRKRMNAPTGSMISISNLKPCLSLSFHYSANFFVTHFCYVLLEIFQFGGWYAQGAYLATTVYPSLSIRRVLCGRDSNLVVHRSCASSPSSQRSDAAMEKLTIAVEIIGPAQQVLAGLIGIREASPGTRHRNIELFHNNADLTVPHSPRNVSCCRRHDMTS